jgi:two-component system, chemotaxis family, CheB/CheR fusion protein
MRRNHQFARLIAACEAAEKRLAGLTGREYHIVKLVLLGHPSKNIAADLGIANAPSKTIGPRS